MVNRSHKCKGVHDLREILYFLSFISIPWLLYRGFRILILAQPPYVLAASLRLGAAFVIFIGAVSLPRNAATFEKEYKEIVGYPSTQVTLQFATLDNSQKQQILQEMADYFSDTEKMLKVTQKKATGKGPNLWYRTPEKNYRTWHDTIPTRYRWQENRLEIATGRPLEDEEIDTLEAVLRLTIAQENHSVFSELLSQSLENYHLQRKVQFRP